MCALLGDTATAVMQPVSMKITGKDSAGTHAELRYPGGMKLTVQITPGENYFRMELTGLNRLMSSATSFGDPTGPLCATISANGWG